MRTESANVPAAQQNLAATNLRATMDVDRFPRTVRTEMPAMAPRENDAQEAVVDRSTTPNTLAEKAEKDTQKRLRNKA
jgi:hypothetical protein